MNCANSLLKYRNLGKVIKKLRNETCDRYLIYVSYNNASFLITMLFFLSLKKLLLKISDNFRKHQCRNLFLNKDRLKLHAATIFVKKDTSVTPILQSSWMNHFALRYSEAAVQRFSSK